MVYQPGQSGNPGGRPKHKAWRDALERAVHQLDEGTKRPKLELVAEACIKAALDGDAQAYKEIGDRLDGKVPQANILTGDEDGGPVRFAAIERHVIDPQNSNGAGVSAVSETEPV